MNFSTIQQLFIHPIKGLTPQSCDRVILEADRGIRGDRALALMFEGATEDPSPMVPWMRKQHFAVQNDWPGLAALKCHYDWDSHRLSIRQNRTEILVANAETDRHRISRFFCDYLATLTPTEAAKPPHPRPVRLVGMPTGETRYPDRHKVHISIVSQATLDAIGKAMGQAIDVRRFRPNLLIDGVEAWEEFSWVGRSFEIAEAKITISAPIGRCLNIEVNPDTGDRDLPLLSGLKQHFGHAKTGVVATVSQSGAIAIGDRFQPV